MEEQQGKGRAFTRQLVDEAEPSVAEARSEARELEEGLVLQLEAGSEVVSEVAQGGP